MDNSVGHIIAGRKPVMEALKAGRKIERIILLAGSHGRVIDEIRDLANQRRVAVEEHGKAEFRKHTDEPSTQGILAIVAPKALVDLNAIVHAAATSTDDGFIVILDEIEDPHNLGALIRSAECAGVHGIVIPKHHAATVTQTVVKTSAGATEYVPVAEVTNISNAIGELKKLGYWITGLDANGEKLFSEVDYTGRAAIVVGSEGKGIRRLVREQCDFLVRIPLRGRIDSLNASVAGALVMYEVLRQRSTRKQQ